MAAAAAAAAVADVAAIDVAGKSAAANSNAARDDATNGVVADILAAATHEFARYGLGGARLERIIAQTRTSKRMVYYHFGSKEGLYQAVLEHNFANVRTAESDFDANAGTPLQALQRFAGIAFDAFDANPDFVRLLTHENLNGAPYVKQSPSISRLNLHGLALVQTILERGQAQGSMRTDLSALDVYINLVGMSYYHVANRAGYLAGFGGSVGRRIKAGSFGEARRKAIVEATARFVARQEV